MKRRFRLVFGDRLLPLSARLEDLTEDQVVSRSLGRSFYRAFGILGCFGQLTLFHLDKGKINKLVWISIVDRDRAAQIIPGFGKPSRAVVSITQIVVRKPGARIVLYRS